MHPCHCHTQRMTCKTKGSDSSHKTVCTAEQWEIQLGKIGVERIELQDVLQIESMILNMQFVISIHMDTALVLRHSVHTGS